MWTMLLLAPLLACSTPAGKLGEVAEEEVDPSGGTELPPASERMAVLTLDDGALDVLFVVDNSGSMGQEQANASRAIAEFATRNQELLGGDLRIGFTTTDDGNPWCQGTGPEGGQLLLRSCRERLSEFVFDGAQVIDVTDLACLDQCALESVTTSPTTTHVDSTMASRPWIEAGPGGTNLAAGVALDQAISCVAPLGINGCGFESHLGSMSKAILRGEFPEDPMYGFMRPWARLAVVFITDEVDCSSDSTWEEIFLPDGNRAFWSDRDAAAPTSAVCWNAGVQCEQGSGDLGACNPQNYDVMGNVTDASSAVMRSLTHFIEDLDAVEAGKAAYRPTDSVGLTLIAGLPIGYAEGTAELEYSRGIDPDFSLDFGADPGCSTSVGQAVPPVRMRNMAELFPVGGEANMHSICGDDYGPALTRLSESMGTPRLDTVACVPGCLADTDERAAGTQASCDVVMARARDGGRFEQLLAACDEGAVPSEQDACYVLRTDDEAASCGAGSNVELELVLRDGLELQGVLTIEAACEQADAASC